ncbi:hypothetical protein [Clostridium sp. 001]|uniref:hypothetical protein n=1 Tax=Clostridium sp. 001 TaxID=1970093 RepID=UPI001C2BCD49|nr:hypothetical protein [Clostridium sp. 001]QXE20008.1 hypothetical protein B5S50_14910 [Clostridium sp. 001]
MTSYELLDFYEELLNEMQNLSAYNDTLSGLLNEINKNQDNLLNLIYPDTFDINNANILGELSSRKAAVISCVQKFAMDFDILGNHQKLIRSRDAIETIFKKYQLELEDEKNKIINLLDEYDQVTSTIYQYVKSRSNSIIVELINKTSLIVNNYNKFVSNYQNIKSFMLKTENKIEEKEDEKILKLHFYDKHINPEYFIKNIQAVKNSYEIMCQILNVSLSEHELKILKVESGSLFLSIIGSASVISAFAFLMKKTIDLVFNKYTFEGQVLRCKQILDLLGKDAEITEKYKKLGIDINEENAYKYNYKLVKSIGTLVRQTAKVKIDDKIFSLEDHLKQKYLEESKTLLIKEANVEKQSEEIPEEDTKESTNQKEE